MLSRSFANASKCLAVWATTSILPSVGHGAARVNGAGVGLISKFSANSRPAKPARRRIRAIENYVSRLLPSLIQYK
jgi:hypothetical protein